MTDAQRVMNSRRYVQHYRAGNQRIVVLDDSNPFHQKRRIFNGHTWTEAFRKAALHLVTQRVTQ